MISALLTLSKPSFQLCQKHNRFAASAHNLCLFLIHPVAFIGVKGPTCLIFGEYLIGA